MAVRSVSHRRLLHLWERLHTSYYFVPGAMLIGAFVAAAGLVAADKRLDGQVTDSGWLYTGTADDARVLLPAIASSVITVAGVVFSITIATLTQASNQFGPRLLRNFMRDISNQLVLGTFVATFVYSLLVLRSVGRAAPDAVPHLAVNGAILLAVSSIVLLVYFIHHISLSLQAPHVAATVWRDLRQAIDQAYPQTLGHDGPPPDDPASPFPDEFEQQAVVLAADRAGYLQAIDEQELLEFAVQHDLRCQLLVRPGDFVILHNPLLRVAPAERINKHVRDQLRELFMVGHHRTPEQDLEFAILQLSELAVRALSPGINDPYTAMNCIDWLGDALAEIAANGLHSPYRYDGHGVLRVTARITTFPGLVASAVDHIRQYGRTSAPVTIRLLEMIASVAIQLDDESYRAPLRRQAAMIERQSHTALPAEEDRQAVKQRYEVAVQRLK